MINDDLAFDRPIKIIMIKNCKSCPYMDCYDIGDICTLTKNKIYDKNLILSSCPLEDVMQFIRKNIIFNVQIGLKKGV